MLELEVTDLLMQTSDLEKRHVISVIILWNSVVPISSSIVTSIQLPTFSALQLSSELHIFFSFQACYNSEACNILYRLKVVFFLSVHFSPLPVLLSRWWLLCVFNTFT